ncbi:hypothetical protein DFJ74DRAFT_115860 [Hyaloraphidium curvatum]|nr:hypothetical protein DFJ74DRAFT_115860 [Hyaloraphidium curvatum]
MGDRGFLLPSARLGTETGRDRTSDLTTLPSFPGLCLYDTIGQKLSIVKKDPQGPEDAPEGHRERDQRHKHRPHAPVRDDEPQDLGAVPRHLEKRADDPVVLLQCGGERGRAEFEARGAEVAAGIVVRRCDDGDEVVARGEVDRVDEHVHDEEASEKEEPRRDTRADTLMEGRSVSILDA